MWTQRRTLAIQWRHLGVGMQRLASAVPQLRDEHGGAYWQTKAFQTSQPLFPNKMTICGSVYRVYLCLRKVWMVRATQASARKRKSFADEETMLRPIPYRTRGTVARPASGHSCRPTSLQWQTRRTACVFANTGSSFSRSLQEHWPLRSGLACCARDVTSTLSAPGPAVAVFEV